jgi:hypothetical protein
MKKLVSFLLISVPIPFFSQGATGNRHSEEARPPVCLVGPLVDSEEASRQAKEFYRVQVENLLGEEALQPPKGPPSINVRLDLRGVPGYFNLTLPKTFGGLALSTLSPSMESESASKQKGPSKPKQRKRLKGEESPDDEDSDKFK